MLRLCTVALLCLEQLILHHMRGGRQAFICSYTET